MTQRSPTKKEIMEWLQANDHSPEIIPDDTSEFRFGVQRGQVKMQVARPNEKEYIRVNTRIRLPSENENLYTHEKDSVFRSCVMERLPTLNVDIIFLQGSKLAIYDQVFDDGFTYDRLYTAIRSVTLACLSLHNLLFSIVGLDSSPQVPSEDEQSELSYFA